MNANLLEVERWNKVATHCCVCGLPLVDATSIEFGIGPVCRRKYNYEDAYAISADAALAVDSFLKSNEFPPEVASKVLNAVDSDDSRKAANALVYFASAEQGKFAVLAAHALRLLGYAALAGRIEDRLIPIRLTEKDGRVVVKTPFHPGFIALVRQIRTRRWDGDAKLWSVAVEDKPALWDAIRKSYAGSWGIGEKGPFEVK
jgi:hypothetical protein